VRSPASPPDKVGKLSRSGSTLDYISLANAVFDLEESAAWDRGQELARALLAENKVKSGAVSVLVRREQWGEAVGAAIESNDASLLAHVLQQAPPGDAVLEQVARSPECYRVWAQLHGGAQDAVDRVSKPKPKPEMVQAVRVERGLRLVRDARAESAAVFQERAKACAADPILKEAALTRMAIEKACAILGQAYEITMSPVERVRAALMTRNREIVGKVAEAVGIKDALLVRCKLEHAFATNDPSYTASIATHATKKSELRTVVDMGIEFAVRGRKDLAIVIRNAVAGKVDSDGLAQLDTLLP
jgi:hypothetical protein